MNGHIQIDEHTTVVKGEPWFEDGNIVLVTQENPTGYRVHKGVLSRHSEIFNHMLDIPQPEESLEGYQTAILYDSPVELANLIKALYDGPTFSNRSIDDFFYVAGILRLASKYFIGQLRRKSIQFLGRAWPSTLAGHDSMIEEALSVRAVNNLSYPFAHPLHVLNLAREVDAPVIIPSVIYFLSMYTLSDIIKADHPKLLVEHPSRPSSSLTASDLLLYSLMYQHRLQLMDKFMRQFCPERASKPTCGQLATCGKGFSRLISQLHRFWTLKTGPLHFISQAMDKVTADPVICTSCRTTFHHDCSSLRQQIWKELPTIAKLSSWKELHESMTRI